jgi:sec-independent protein translocase protein TatC
MRGAMTDARLPITDHLAELRSRIIRMLLAWVACAVVAWNFNEQIFGFLLEPAVEALGEDRTLQAIAPTEIFFTYLKCAVLAGFVFALPVIFWQIWAFVAPGLYAGEKKTLVPFVVVSCVLFVGGATFGYTQVFPLMFNFFTGFDSAFVTSAWTMREVFALTTRLFLAFGVAFELPVAVFFLSLAGIVDASTLLRRGLPVRRRAQDREGRGHPVATHPGRALRAARGWPLAGARGAPRRIPAPRARRGRSGRSAAPCSRCCRPRLRSALR